MKFWVLLVSANGLHFDMEQRETRCFIEDIPPETQMTWKYEVTRFNLYNLIINIIVDNTNTYVSERFLIKIQTRRNRNTVRFQLR